MSSFYLFYKSNKYLIKNNNSLFVATDNVTNPIIGSYNINAGIKDTKINDDTCIQADNANAINVVTYEIFNEAPYVNTEYYEPICYLGEDLVIQYYVMDYAQEDYFLDKYMKEFLVIVEFGGTIFRRKVKAGNHKINLGKPTNLGETYFSIQCIDLSNNYESAKHYKHLMVVDRNIYQITDEQVYTMTSEDLTSYSIVASTDGIKITDEEGSNNITGINNLLSTIRDQGYRKIVFYNPNGDNDNRYTYYLQPYNDKSHSIVIPSGLTVDLNNCKWKQLVSYGISSLLVSFETDGTDSHLINGYIWGNYDEHIVDKTRDDYPGDLKDSNSIEGEGYVLISLNGAFNSLENINHAYGTGYSIMDGNNNSVCTDPIIIWTNNYLDNLGNEVNSGPDIWTSDYVELTNDILNYKYIVASPYRAYGGLAGKSNDEIITYYDINKEYIKKEKVRQYGLSLIPQTAKYVRLTLTSNTVDSIINISPVGFRIEAMNYKPTTCWNCYNVYSHDCRTVAYATGVYDHLMIDNCKIENCGQKIGNGQVTALAIDVEDGYQRSEALYIKDLECINGSLGSSIVNLVTTYDVHVYGINHCALNAHKTFGLNLHDTTITGYVLAGRLSHMQTGFMMIYNAEMGGLRLPCSSDPNDLDALVKDCIIGSQINNFYNDYNVNRNTFKRCVINLPGIVRDENFVDCIFNAPNISYVNSPGKFTNCIFRGDGEIRINQLTEEAKFNSCDIGIKCTIQPGKENSEGRFVFIKCKLLNSTLNSNKIQFVFNNCEEL